MHLGGNLVILKQLAAENSELGCQERESHVGLWHLGAAGAWPVHAARGARSGGRNQEESEWFGS